MGVELRKGLSVTDSVESKAGGLRAALLRLFPVTLVIAALFFVGFQNGYVRIQYPTRDDYPVRGVDVSRHQNEIDWPALATGSEIDFAFMKASEGTDLLFWQYAGTGRLEGVETLVDLNVFVGSRASFEKQLDEGAGTVER